MTKTSPNGHPVRSPIDVRRTVFLLVEDRFDHRTVGIFDSEAKAVAAAEAVCRRNPKRYKDVMSWELFNGRRVYQSKNEHQWFEIVPIDENSYFDGTVWQRA